jgi:hypothetical protein
LFLVKAIPVFDAATQAPIGVALLGSGDVEQGDVREQRNRVGMQVVFCIIGARNSASACSISATASWQEFR